MILAIDIGNTNMEFGVYENDKIKASFRVITNREITSDELGLTMMQFFSFNNIDRKGIKDVIISSVVPQVMYSVNNAIKKYLDRTALVANVNMPIGIKNCYSNPAEVGTDRLVSSYAALKKYGGTLIVIDFGTATTFDAINAQGEYLGGAIYPGLKISMEALFSRTAKLPRVEIVDPGCVIGKNTVSSMQSGVLFGYVGAVENLVRLMKQDLGEETKVIATGGLASLISSHASCINFVDRPIMLDGLLMIYKDYKQAQK